MDLMAGSKEVRAAWMMTGELADCIHKEHVGRDRNSRVETVVGFALETSLWRENETYPSADLLHQRRTFAVQPIELTIHSIGFLPYAATRDR